MEHFRLENINGLERLKKVNELCLRNNLLKKIENLDCLSETLQNLDLYDNKIKVVENLENLTLLQ